MEKVLDYIQESRAELKKGHMAHKQLVVFNDRSHRGSFHCFSLSRAGRCASHGSILQNRPIAWICIWLSSLDCTWR